MNDKDQEIALFRLTVLGPLASRAKFVRGDIKKICHELAANAYHIPYSRQCRLSYKTIERWYYAWLRGGFDALLPKKRSDYGHSTIDKSLQDAILALKNENPSRSINTIKYLLETEGLVAHNELSRASLHRFLQKHQLSKRTPSNAETIERRSFEATYAGDIWHGDVMHGPTIHSSRGRRKSYLVSLLDDASRIVAHNAFCFGETALDIEGVLKQALLKRGIPKKIIIDNGPGYRAKTLQLICAKLEIRLVYCPAYEPEGKGKLERWHRTFRDQFLSELNMENIKDINDLNARLWAWLEQVYHQNPHSGLASHISPIERWRKDIVHVRPLGIYANDIDDYFYHRIDRRVKKDGTISWNGVSFEVPYELSGKKITLVIDPHDNRAVKVESLQGKFLGDVHKLDKNSNCSRKRQRPTSIAAPDNSSMKKRNLVEMAYEKHKKQQIIQDATHDEEED